MAIALREVSMAFAGNTVLDRASIDLTHGEIHALLGQNGAGKSTLIKILAGAYVRTGGEVVVHGEALPRRFGGREMLDRGVAFVHQDRGLIDDLSVAENIAMVVGFPRRRSGLIGWREVRRRAASLLADVGEQIDVRAPCSALDPSARSIVAIARAMAMDATTLVLDEPTASLRNEEAQSLYHFMRAARDRGVAFLHVTHHLDEVFDLADRVTVLRDGRPVIAGSSAAELTRERLVESLTGRRQDQAAAPRTRRRSPGEVALRVEGLADDRLEPLDMTLRRGQITGFTGLVGSGHEAVPRILFGVSAPTAGRLELCGHPAPIPRSPSQAIAAGIHFVPGDRHHEGLVLGMPVRANVFLNRSSWQGMRWCAPLHAGAERREAVRLGEQLEIRPNSPERTVGELSGGNQQKVLMARWLREPCDVLFVEDPTVGVDVGAKADIYAALAAAADAGTAVVVASSDEEEVAAICDRALVFADGAVVAELGGSDLTEANVIVSGSLGTQDPGDRRAARGAIR